MFGIRFSFPLRFTANPFEWTNVRNGHYPGYSSTTSWSDYRTAILPPCLLLGLLEASFWERHGSPKFRCKPLDYLLRTQTPARRDTLTQNACRAAGFQDMKPLALRRR